MFKKKWAAAALVAALSVTALVGIKPTDVKAETDVKAIVDGMSVEQKVGQMLMPDFRNWQEQGESKATGFTEMNDEVGSIIQKYHLGALSYLLKTSWVRSKRSV